MFKLFSKTLVLSVIILIVAGCFGGYSGDAGLDVSDVVPLDDEIQVEITVENGDVFGLDMPDPSAKGHAVTGASFDPALLRVERYLEYDDDGEPRLRYLFTAIGDGTTQVVIKMRTSGGMSGIYRTAKVVIGEEE